MTDKLHVFEKAGLGKAPFRLVGMTVEVGPYKWFDPKYPGVMMECGAPGQPMGTCRYCGQGIKDCYWIKSADEKRFMVGCICVNKTGDTGLTSPVNDKARALKLERRHEAEEKRIAAGRVLFDKPEVRKVLDAMTSPTPYNKTALGWVEWMLANAGNAGRIRACRVVEKAAEGVGT